MRTIRESGMRIDLRIAWCHCGHMRRGTAATLVLASVLTVGAAALAVPGAQAMHSVFAATCTPAQKAQEQAALAAYRERTSAVRSAYFAHRKSAMLRGAFVRGQQARQKSLEAAAVTALCTGGAIAAAVPAPIPAVSAYSAQSGAMRSCTRAERARRARRLATYKRQMKAARRAYFKTHRSKRSRLTFVRGQNAHLNALKRALANCRQTDLAVALTAAPATVAASESETQTIAVANHGPADASDVTLTVSGLATILAVASATSTVGTCTASPGALSCQIGSLAAAAATTVTVVVRADLLGTVTETATAVGAETDPNEANNTAQCDSDGRRTASICSCPGIVCGR